MMTMEMIIAGAGIIGMSCAWKLAGCKIPVTIFDARETGAEASWAGAGMLAPGGEMEEASSVTEMALRSLAMYSGFVNELQEESGTTIDFSKCGALEIALESEEAATLEERARRQSSLGIRSQEARFPGAIHSRFYPDDAIVDPRQIMSALRIACVRRNVQIIEHERVLEILPGGAGVRTSNGTYRDDAVLVTAGAWSSELVSTLRLPGAKPVRGHLISWNAQPGMLGTILRRQNTYLLQRASGTIVAGSTTEDAGFDRTIDESIVKDIAARASCLLPTLRSLPVCERWVGFRPGIESGVPKIGRAAGTNIWTAYGHYRNGILLAPDTAEQIAQSVTQAH
jgi:glycine oxidase